MQKILAVKMYTPRTDNDKDTIIQSGLYTWTCMQRLKKQRNIVKVKVLSIKSKKKKHPDTIFKYTRNQKVKDIKHKSRREKNHTNTICKLQIASINCCIFW